MMLRLLTRNSLEIRSNYITVILLTLTVLGEYYYIRV